MKDIGNWIKTIFFLALLWMAPALGNPKFWRVVEDTWQFWGRVIG